MKFLALSVFAAITTALLVTPSSGQKGSTPSDGIDPILTQFWKTWDEDSPNAAIVSLSSLGASAEQGRIQALADQMTGAMSRLGLYHGRDEISRVAVGARLVRVRYLLRFETMPMFLDLIYYRPDTRWKLSGINFETDDKKIITELSSTHESPQNVADAR